MSRRVAVCAVAQTRYEANKWKQRMQGLVWEVVKEVRTRTGLGYGKDQIQATVTCSDDVFDGRTISNNAITDVVGAHFQAEEKVSADGIQAVYYATAMILSGHYDIVLLAAHSKESQPESRNQVTHLAFDPFFGRPLGLDYVVAAALQARAFMARTGLEEETLAELVVRSRRWAAQNPVAQNTVPITREEVLASPYVADPIREAFMYPVSDGAIAMIFASEERAREITDIPVWVTGVGNCYDTFNLGERDLGGGFPLNEAARRAYRMAGINEPHRDFDVIEIADGYVHQLPQYAEAMGIVEGGDVRTWCRTDGPERRNVNRSGGMLAGNPLLLGGLARVAECVLQLRGEAGTRQVPHAHRAVAQGSTGPAGQLQTVVVLEN